MKKLFLCSYFAGVKDTFKDFMNNVSFTPAKYEHKNRFFI